MGPVRTPGCIVPQEPYAAKEVMIRVVLLLSRVLAMKIAMSHMLTRKKISTPSQVPFFLMADLKTDADGMGLDIFNPLKNAEVWRTVPSLQINGGQWYKFVYNHRLPRDITFIWDI